jgi:hypothetical protein
MLRYTRIFAFALAAVVVAAFSVPINAQWNPGSGGTIYYDGGNVGIGTTSPATSLQVKGSGLTVGATYEDGDTANYGLIVQTNQASGNYAYLGLLRGQHGPQRLPWKCDVRLQPGRVARFRSRDLFPVHLVQFALEFHRHHLHHALSRTQLLRPSDLPLGEPRNTPPSRSTFPPPRRPD